MEFQFLPDAQRWMEENQVLLRSCQSRCYLLASAATHLVDQLLTVPVKGQQTSVAEYLKGKQKGWDRLDNIVHLVYERSLFFIAKSLYKIRR